MNRIIVVSVIVALVTTLALAATATMFETGISQQKVYGQNVATGCPAIYKYGCDAARENGLPPFAQALRT